MTGKVSLPILINIHEKNFNVWKEGILTPKKILMKENI